MPPLPLNPDGTINTDQYAYQNGRDAAINQQQVSDQSSKKKSVSKSSSKADTSDIDKQIKLYKDALKEASGFKRTELQQALDIANADRAEKIHAADIAADASKYGSDQSLEGTKYSSDKSLAGTKYSSDNSLKGTQYSADKSLQGTQYSSDNSAASSRYGTDADLYKFNAGQPLARGAQALSFLQNYEGMASHPDSFLQASNYARLGQQTEGMPAMLSDLMGNINPNGAPTGGNLAFRSGGANMPQTSAQAVFGNDPLNIGTRAPTPDMPTWYGHNGSGDPTGGGMPTWYGSGAPSQAQTGMYSSAPINAQAYAQPGQYPIMQAAGTTQSPYASYGMADTGQAPSAFSAVSPYASTYGINTSQYEPTAHRGALASYGSQGGMPASMTTASQGYQGGKNGGYGNYGAYGQASGGPRVMNGQVVSADSSADDAFKANVAKLMQRGAQTWGNQSLERMTGTERDMLASGIKANGGVAQDYMDAYARSRIGNDGSGRAL